MQAFHIIFRPKLEEKYDAGKLNGRMEWIMIMIILTSVVWSIELNKIELLNKDFSDNNFWVLHPLTLKFIKPSSFHKSCFFQGSIISNPQLSLYVNTYFDFDWSGIAFWTKKYITFMEKILSFFKIFNKKPLFIKAA